MVQGPLILLREHLRASPSLEYGHIHTSLSYICIHSHYHMSSFTLYYHVFTHTS